MENNNELISETINETTSEVNKTNKMLDVAKVIAGIALIVFGLYVFLMSNPTTKTLINQRLTHKANTAATPNNDATKNKLNETIVPDNTTTNPNGEAMGNNEETVNNNKTAAHTHTFTILTKTLTDAEGETRAERYYACECGLELKMNE